MSDFKYQFLTFSYLTIYDYKSIEDNLTAMAAKGWRIESIGAFLWKFKRSKPSNKKFFVLLTSSDSVYESVSIERQGLLEELCVKGWKKEFQCKQMQIFCADQDAMPLETDEAVRLENIHQNMKKTFIPNWTKLLFFMLVIAFFNGMKYFGIFPYRDEKTVWAFLITLYAAFIVGINILGYLFWLKSSRKRISEGGTCVSTAWYRRLLIVLLIGFLATFIGSFMDSKLQIEGLIFYIIIYIIAAFITVSFINLFSQLFKKKGLSSGISTILLSIVTVLLIIGLIVIMNVLESIIYIF